MKFAAAFLAGGLIAAPAQACQLALSLALDVSSSVDAIEFKQQAQGLASALTDPDVMHAMFAVKGAPIAIHVYQWSGPSNQLTVLDWTTIDSPAVLDRVVSTIRTMPRSAQDFPTSLGYGLSYGALALRNSPPCARKTLDVSGDGRNNHGYGPALALRHFPFANVTVNGLAIGGEDRGIFDYYLHEVIKGPGAFVEYARNFDDYERAMRRKLLREIGNLMVSQSE